MTCEHLKPLDDALTAAGVHVYYRDQKPWAYNCRNWTRYAVTFDMAAVRERFNLDDCVVDWEIDDIWQGSERGFVCNEHRDAIIGDIFPRRESMRSWFAGQFATWAFPVIFGGLMVIGLACVLVFLVRR